MNFLCFSDNTKLSSSFQPSYDDDTASKEAIEEDWIIVDGPRIGNADGQQHQQISMLQNVDGVFNAEVLGGSNEDKVNEVLDAGVLGGSKEVKVDEVFNEEVPAGINEAKVDEVINAGVLGGSNEAIVDKVVNTEVLGGSNEAKVDEANCKVDVEDSSNAEGNFNQTTCLLV